MSDAVLRTYFDGQISEIKKGLFSHHSRWMNQASGVSSVLLCTDSPWTLLAHLTRFGWNTKPSRFALTLGVLSVNTRLHNLLIWESDKEKSLLSQSLCSEHFDKVGYWSPACQNKLPSRHFVQPIHHFRLLLCEVYVPSSHSTHFPFRPAVVQGDSRRVPKTKQKPKTSLSSTSS